MKTLKKRQRLDSVEAYACSCIAASCICSCDCVCTCSPPALAVSGANTAADYFFAGRANHSYALIHELTDVQVS